MRLPKAIIHQKYTTLYLMGHKYTPAKTNGADTSEDDAQQVFLRYVTSQRIWEYGI